MDILHIWFGGSSNLPKRSRKEARVRNVGRTAIHPELSAYEERKCGALKGTTNALASQGKKADNPT